MRWCVEGAQKRTEEEGQSRQCQSYDGGVTDSKSFLQKQSSRQSGWGWTHCSKYVSYQPRAECSRWREGACIPGIGSSSPWCKPRVFDIAGLGSRRLFCSRRHRGRIHWSACPWTREEGCDLTANLAEYVVEISIDKRLRKAQTLTALSSFEDMWLVPY